MVPIALVWDCANYKMKQIVNLIKQRADSGQSESAVVLQGSRNLQKDCCAELKPYK